MFIGLIQPHHCEHLLWRDKLQSHSKPTLRDLQTKSHPSSVTSTSSVLTFPLESGTLLNSQPNHDSPVLSITSAPTAQDEVSLASVTVPLESIKPSKNLACLYMNVPLRSEVIDVIIISFLFSSFRLTGSMLPVTIFDKHSLRVLFHFARDSPPSRPDVLVVIISMLSSAPIPLTNIRFQAAVPKVAQLYSVTLNKNARVKTFYQISFSGLFKTLW